MKTLSYTITCPQGLHAINGSAICRKARDFKCLVEACKEGQKVDCKNVMALLMLGAKPGQEICFSFEGEDEERALALFRAFLPDVL